MLSIFPICCEISLKCQTNWPYLKTNFLFLWRLLATKYTMKGPLGKAKWNNTFSLLFSAPWVVYIFRVNSTKPEISPYFRRIIAITLLNLFLGRKTKIKVGNHLILFHLNWNQAQEICKKLRSKSCFICIFIAICVRHIGFLRLEIYR
jgi:hypothetical protein